MAVNGIDTRKGWSSNLPSLALGSLEKNLWYEMFRNKAPSPVLICRGTIRTVPNIIIYTKEGHISLYSLTPFLLFSRHFRAVWIAWYAFLTNWLFSAFTQSLQSASANVRKLSENHKCLAKKRKNRALLLYLITERAEYQRKAIYLHLNTIITLWIKDNFCYTKRLTVIHR